MSAPGGRIHLRKPGRPRKTVIPSLFTLFSFSQPPTFLAFWEIQRLVKGTFYKGFASRSSACLMSRVLRNREKKKKVFLKLHLDAEVPREML